MMTTPTNSSDAAIRRALEILSGMTTGYSTAGSGTQAQGGAMYNAAQQAANAAGGGGGNTGNTNTSGGGGNIPPQLAALMDLMLQRMQYQEPLFRSVTRQAVMGLPTYAQATSLGIP